MANVLLCSPGLPVIEGKALSPEMTSITAEIVSRLQWQVPFNTEGSSHSSH